MEAGGEHAAVQCSSRSSPPALTAAEPLILLRRPSGKPMSRSAACGKHEGEHTRLRDTWGVGEGRGGQRRDDGEFHGCATVMNRRGCEGGRSSGGSPAGRIATATPL
jgi:hypothetical protein